MLNYSCISVYYLQITFETQLLRPEIDAADQKTQTAENIVDEIDIATAECQQCLEKSKAKQQERRRSANQKLAEYCQVLEEYVH